VGGGCRFSRFAYAGDVKKTPAYFDGSNRRHFPDRVTRFFFFFLFFFFFFFFSPIFRGGCGARSCGGVIACFPVCCWKQWKWPHFRSDIGSSTAATRERVFFSSRSPRARCFFIARDFSLSMGLNDAATTMIRVGCCRRFKRFCMLDSSGPVGWTRLPAFRRGRQVAHTHLRAWALFFLFLPVFGFPDLTG